jgi:hypothetical protein
VSKYMWSRSNISVSTCKLWLVSPLDYLLVLVLVRGLAGNIGQ